MPDVELRTGISRPVRVATTTQATRSGACVRAFAEDDIEEVARLHKAAFGIQKISDPKRHRDYFRRVFLENPSRDDALPSLVYQEASGRLAGFIGVVPRRVSLGGRSYRVAVSSQFVVDPANPSGLVALRLVRSYLEGPQDLSIADEANERSRVIWEGLGGTTALLLSIYWTRPLRPVRLALDRLALRYRLRALAVAATPLVAGADSLAATVPGSYFRQARPAESGSDLTPSELVTHATTFRNPKSLHVDYDEATAAWLLDRAAVHGADGKLLATVVRDGSDVIGWYICHLDREGNAEVAQIEATPASVSRVLDHLFYEAWTQGAVAVTGRLEPRYMQALSDKYCVFHRRGPWMLVKTSNAELQRAFEAGTTNFSRLDGEWSLRYLAPPTAPQISAAAS